MHVNRILWPPWICFALGPVAAAMIANVLMFPYFMMSQ